MMVFKRKQIVVLALVLMIVIAGYLQYSYKKDNVSVSKEEEGRLGEAVYVDSQDLLNEEKESLFNLSAGEGLEASKQANDFFAQAKLDREITRSRDKDAFREMVDDPNATEQVKAEAYNHMMAIIKNTEKEMRIENLVKERGYSDVIVLFADDGSVDVIVKSESLNDSKVAQIADVVTRQADIEMSQVHIKNMF